MRSAAELDAQIRQTRAFIDANYEEIALVPRVESKTEAGGRVWVAGVARAPQRFHFIDRVTTARTDTRVPGGEQNEEEVDLLGYPDAVIEVNDTFTHGGREYLVKTVDRKDYEVIASVIHFGR